MPTPMMNEASIRPSSRNTLPCRELVSSGWRAARLQEAAAHDAHADAGAERAQADHEADADAGVGLDHRQHLKFFHWSFPFLNGT